MKYGVAWRAGTRRMLGKPAARNDVVWLVALEGPSGVGKSTLVPLVATWFISQNIAAPIVSNADAPLLGPIIRGLAGDFSRPYSLALATATARAAIFEMRNKTAISIADRFILSSLVYQSYAGVPAEYLLSINQPFIGGTIHVLLHVPESVLTRRRKDRSDIKLDAFKRSMAPNEEIRRFDEAATVLSNQGAMVLRISAQGEPDSIAADIATQVQKIRSRPST